MVRNKKEVTTFDFVQPKVPAELVISLNEFLSKHNGQRSLDNIIRKCFTKKDPLNPKKTISEWSKLIEEFHNETER